MLAAVLEQLKNSNHQLKKMTKQLNRLETRLNDLYEYTSSPIIAAQFGQDFADSLEISTCAHVVDHLMQLAYNLDLPALKQRSECINTLEQKVLRDRQGLRAAVRALLEEACEQGSCSMVSIPRDFANAPLDDIRACLEEIKLGLGPQHPGLQRFSNLQRTIDALETGPPPRPLPGWLEMATALSSGRCLGGLVVDCRGRIDLRDTYVEFHFGAFKGVNEGFPETRRTLRQAAALFTWAYKALEAQIYTGQPRDVEAVGYCFAVGKTTTNEDLKLYDELAFEIRGKRITADLAYRYFAVKPAGLQERYAKG